MPSNNTTAAKKIAEKWHQLKGRGLDLGPSTSSLKGPFHGGYYQVFQRGRIYHHPAIGTYEVHGNVLLAYLDRKAMDHNPKVGRREFGFPTSDEKRTDDGLYARSEFEWGEIINVKGAWGAVGISGEIYKKWKKENWVDRVGYPINGNVSGASGELVYFERGIGYYSQHTLPEPIILDLSFPLLGNPAILRPKDAEIPIRLLIDQGDLDKIGGSSTFRQFVTSRVYLQEVGTSRRIPIATNAVKRNPTKKTTAAGRPVPISRQFTLIFALEKGARLLDRVLYDIVFRLDNGHYYSLSPHAIYVKESWDNFGLIHATDIHVSRRIDGFRNKLYQFMIDNNDQTFQNGVNAFNNWNENFRDLIKYANFLHIQGQLDGIIATGDLVDYLYEDGENRKGGGNFALLKDLVLGKSKYPNADKFNEELQVPIFTTLGNHDYRINAYRLHQKLDLQWPIPNRLIPQYSGFNLEENEAEAIDGYHFISTDDGLEQLKIATPHYYLKYINTEKSYIVNLGEHRLLMIDSGSDIGIADTGDAILNFFGFGSEDKDTFLKGSPNSEGYNQSDLNLLKKIVKNPDKNGIVIIGTHAPPINTARTEYPHYFRETEHPSADEYETALYLWRVKIGTFSHRQEILNWAKKYHSDWSLNKTPFFKIGNHENLLDWGVSRGKTTEFLDLCAGKEEPYPGVDLVLFGHIHTRTELRIKWNRDLKQLEYFHDYYSQNPDYYYRSKKSKGSFDEVEGIVLEIRNSVSPNGIPSKDETGRKVLPIPPYPKPLNQSDNPAAWWQDHRPLFIQGAPLGPMDNKQRVEYPEPNFQGCKLIKVSNNHINRIQQVPIHQIRTIEPQVGRYYYLHSKVSDLPVDVTFGSMEEGAKIIQYAPHGQANQIWVLKKVEGISEYVYVLSARSGKVLTVHDQTHLIVQRSIAQNDDALHRRQQWRLIPTGDGYYYLYNRGKYLMLDVRGGNKLSGGEVWGYPSNETPAQKWRFLEIDKYSYSYLPPEEGRDYFIKAKVSNHYLDVKGGSLTANTPIIQWSLHGGDNQVWQIKSVPGDSKHFYLISKKSKQCLTVKDGARRQGTLIVQYPKQSGTSSLHLAQQWRMEPARTRSHYLLINRLTGWVMDVRGGSKNEGADIWTYASNQSNAQQWHFIIDERSQKIPARSPISIQQTLTARFSTSFPDAWKDFHHPKTSDERYYQVDFRVEATFFPARFQNLRIQRVALAFLTEDGRLPPMAVALNVGKEQSTNRMTYDGKVNSWSGDFQERWENMIGQSPIGPWNLAVPNNDTVWGWFKEGIITDIALTIHYEATIVP